MKLAFSNSLLGEYDYQGESLSGNQKPTYQKIGIVGIIIIVIIAINVLGSIIGSCSSCLSNGCSSCGCGSSSSSSGCGSSSSSSGCKSSSSSSSSSMQYYDTYYCTVYNNVTNEAATFSQTVYKVGCKKTQDEWYGSFRSIDYDTYQFDGYYKDDSFSKRISANDFSNGKTYYAKFVEKGLNNPVTFVFASNLPDEYYGYGIDSVVGYIGQAMPSTVNYMAPPGYAFLGVYRTSSKTSSQVYDANGNVTTAYRELTSKLFGTTSGTVTLFALYAPERYSLELFNGETGHLITSYDVYYDDKVYTYIGSYIEEIQNDPRRTLVKITDAVNTEISVSELKSAKITKSVSYRIFVKENMQVTLNYNVDGVEIGRVMYDANTLYSLPIPDADHSPAGYSFDGWYTTSTFDLNSKVSQVYLDSDKVVYAKWKPNTYSIEYRSSLDNTLYATGTYTTSRNAQAFTDTMGNAVLPADFGTVQGYEAVGFVIKEISMVNVVSELPANTYGDLTVLVQYAPKSFGVLLDTGSSSLISKNYNPKLDYGQTFTLEVPYVTSISREFLGYYYGEIQVTDANGNSLIPFTESELGISYILFSSGITFTAKIQTKKFTVNFYDHGSKVDTQTVNYGTTVSTSYVPSPTIGQEFSAWSTSSQTLFKFDFNTSITANYDLYAYYTTKQIKITLDPGIGTLSNRQLNVAYGSSFTASVPTFAEKYQFDGYYFGDIQVTDTFGNSSFNLNELNLSLSYDDLIKGIVIEARKHTKTYTVSYYNDGGFMSSETVEHGQIPNSVPSVVPEVGFTFIGWSLYSSGSQPIYDLSTGVKSTFNLYAVTERAKINVTLDANGGNLLQNKVKVEYRSSNRFAVPTYSDPQYEFVGYYYDEIQITDKNGDLVVIFAESSFMLDYQSFLSDGVTLVARKQVKQLTVNFYEGDSIIDTQIVSYGTTVSTDQIPSTHDGYSYVGWSSSSNNYIAYNFSNTVTQNMNLYASYSPISYTITLDTTYGYITSNTKSVNYDSQFSVQVPNYSEHPELEFVGFFYGDIQVVAANGASLIPFNMESLGLSGMSAIENGIHLEERTQMKEFTVRFMNGTTVWSETKVHYGESIDAAPSPEAPTNYFFKGWTKEVGSTNYYDFANSEIKSNLTLYAKFDNKFTVYLYDSNDFETRTLLTTIVVTYNQEWSISYVYPSALFAGWIDSATGKKITDSQNYFLYDNYKTYTFDKDLILYAYVESE